MGRKVALLVGVGTYGSGLRPLQCPANGVTELHEILADPAIGGFDEVIPLVDPDVGMMRSRIGEVFSRLTKQDLLLFYFTGHGIKDMTGEFYLTTSQTQLFENGRLNPGTAVEAEFLKRIIGNCYAQRKVIILDCCFGAAFGEGFLTMDDGSVDVEADLGGEGWVVLTAATARNYALEQEGELLSVYTRYLVEGLKTGAAADEGAQTITVRQLHGYVREKVQVAAPTMKPSIFNGHQGDEIVLARAVINPELIYRQKVEAQIQLRGWIAPAGRQFLEDWRQRLGIKPERAVQLEANVLKPFVKKQKHLNQYAQTLREEIKEGFPLSSEAIYQLQDLQKLWNLQDKDVDPILYKISAELKNELNILDADLRTLQTHQHTLSPRNLRQNHAQTMRIEPVLKPSEMIIKIRSENASEQLEENFLSDIPIKIKQKNNGSSNFSKAGVIAEVIIEIPKLGRGRIRFEFEETLWPAILHPKYSKSLTGLKPGTKVIVKKKLRNAYVVVPLE